MEKVNVVKVDDENLVAAVESLAHSIWREHYTPIIGRDQVEYMLKRFQSKEAISNQIEKEGYLYYLLGDNNNGWVGYIAVIIKAKELFLSKLYINAENRRKGYGKYSISFIETIALDNGLFEISLRVNKKNTNSIRAYEKFGFIISGPIITDVGNGFVMDDYKMEKVIAH